MRTIMKAIKKCVKWYIKVTAQNVYLSSTGIIPKKD